MRPPLPTLARLYIQSILFGILLACLFTGLLIWLNVANLRHLVSSSDAGPLAVAMLVFFHAIVFSGAQFGIAVMHLAQPDPPAGGAPARRIDHAPARLAAVPAKARS